MNIGQQLKRLLLSTRNTAATIAIKKEKLFATLLIIPFNPAKIAVVFFGDGEGSK